MALFGLMGSGCAHRIDKARLEAELACAKNDAAQKEAARDREQKRADAATTQLDAVNVKLADALGEARGQRERAAALEQNLLYTQTMLGQLQDYNKELVEALEKAWEKKRPRSLVKDLLKVNAAGGRGVVSFETCNECSGGLLGCCEKGP